LNNVKYVEDGQINSSHNAEGSHDKTRFENHLTRMNEAL